VFKDKVKCDVRVNEAGKPCVADSLLMASAPRCLIKDAGLQVATAVVRSSIMKQSSDRVMNVWKVSL
jgi:hypothetical protein